VNAIQEGREPNASVDQVLKCYEVLDRLDQQTAGLNVIRQLAHAKVATPAAQGERYEPAVGFVVTASWPRQSTVAELLANASSAACTCAATSFER